MYVYVNVAASACATTAAPAAQIVWCNALQMFTGTCTDSESKLNIDFPKNFLK
jgi:hypothetical protein